MYICLPHEVEEPRWSNFHTYDRARQERRWRPDRGSGHLWIAIVLACSDFSSKIQSAKNSLVSLSPLGESFKPRGYDIIRPSPSSLKIMEYWLEIRRKSDLCPRSRQFQYKTVEKVFLFTCLFVCFLYRNLLYIEDAVLEDLRIALMV